MGESVTITPEIERMAIAIYEARNGPGAWFESIGHDNWSYHAAVAALEAIREPGGHMINAGGYSLQEHCSLTMSAAQTAWQAMIDSALGR